MSEISPSTILNNIADTLVVEAKYANKEEALRSLAQSAVRDRMLRYRRRIQRLERKYGTGFGGFTCQIEGTATPQQEDDWLTWRYAIDMLDEWKTVYKSLAA